MNVVMPQIAPPSVPANSVASPSTGTNAAPAKFSAVLAQAQDASRSSTQQVTNGNGNQKTPAKSDKNNSKAPSGNFGPIFSKLPMPANNIPSITVSVPNLASPTAKPIADQQAASEDSSDDQVESITDSVTTKTFASQLSSALPATLTGGTITTKTDLASKTLDASEPTQSDKPDATQADSAKSSNNAQQATTNSTAQLGVVTPEDASSVLKTASASVVTGQSPDAINDKQGNSAPKSSSANAPVHGATATSSKSQSSSEPLTQLQIHATSPAQSIAPKPDTSNGETKANTSTANKPDANKKEVNSATEQAIAAAKETLASHASTLTNGGGLQSSTSVSGSTSNPTPTTSSSVSPMSIPAQVQSINATPFGKVATVPAQAQTIANADAAEAAQETAATAASSALHAAKLVAGLEQSELRVGLHAGEFGNVDIRTSLARNQFTAEISVERGELGRVLAAELPALQHRFAEQQLPQANITLQQHTSGDSSDFREGGRQQQNAPPNNFSDSAHEESFLPLIATAETLETTGLDIHM